MGNIKINSNLNFYLKFLSFDGHSSPPRQFNRLFFATKIIQLTHH